jgi:hypothetical protein
VDFFEQNLKILSARDPALCARLRAAKTSENRYRFLESRNGEPVPALLDKSGAAHPLHSTVDPVREARRLIASLEDSGGRLGEGFLVFLGMGAAYAARAALQRADVFEILIIDFDIGGAAELLCHLDYAAILGDPRLNLLIDPSPEEIQSHIIEQYLPALAGGVRALPLRARTEQDIPRFNAAADAIQQTIEKISSDYSVQAHFGARWFSNIIRNLKRAEFQDNAALFNGKFADNIGKTKNPPAAAIRAGPLEAAICAAGPSLDQHIPLLARRKQQDKNIFIIAADTSLPALLRHGLEPDAVLSIDCQHISFYHFLGINCRNIPLFLDLASPPLLADFSSSPFFLSGGHPLARYISLVYRPFPALDTSGGNVTYSCLSLAESLGAEKIYLYGADFSYPQNRIYARGAYIYPYFEIRQNRFASMEAQVSSFLYRGPFLPPEDTSGKNYYETASLRFYRKKFEEKALDLDAQLIVEPGMGGGPLSIQLASKKNSRPGGALLSEPALPNAAKVSPGRAAKSLPSAGDFLEQYKKKIETLPLPGSKPYPHNLNVDERQILATLLPQIAALKRRHSELNADELLEAVKRCSVGQIEKALTD